MFQRILVAVQSANERRSLVAAAAWLASTGSSTAFVVHVRPIGAEDSEALADAEAIVEATVSEARRAGLWAEGEVLTVEAGRDIGRAVAEVAQGWRADLVVVGSRRLSDLQAAWHGSVSHAVIHFVGCPVMVASSEAVPGGATRSILLAVDASKEAAAAEHLVALVAREQTASVSVLHVPQAVVISGPVLGGWYVPPPDTDLTRLQAVERLVELGVDARQVDPVGDGSVASVIAATADHVGADLIVLGSRGLGGVAGLIRGSVSHELLHETPRAVLLARRETD